MRRANSRRLRFLIRQIQRGISKQGEHALFREDFGDAALNFRRAAELRENDFVLWLQLGYALSRTGDVEAAGAAYRRSLELAPNYARPNWLMGLLLLDSRENELEAFQYLRHAARQDQSLYKQIVEIARSRYPTDPMAIEDLAQPQTFEEKKIAVRSLISHDLTTDLVKGWLTSGELSDAEKDEFISQLIEHKKPRIAYETWLSKTSQRLPRSGDKELIHDGGFEYITESDGSGFGWRIDRKVPNAAIALDSKVFHTGSRSLQINFNGNIEAGTQFISQLVLVKPRQEYQLTFAASSPELISGGLPIVIVSYESAGGSFVRSPLLKATSNSWVMSEVKFKTGEEETVLISLQRDHCTSNPCPIFGTLRLDDFSLKELQGTR